MRLVEDNYAQLIWNGKMKLGCMYMAAKECSVAKLQGQP